MFRLCYFEIKIEKYSYEVTAEDLSEFIDFVKYFKNNKLY